MQGVLAPLTSNVYATGKFLCTLVELSQMYLVSFGNALLNIMRKINHSSNLYQTQTWQKDLHSQLLTFVLCQAQLVNKKISTLNSLYLTSFAAVNHAYRAGIEYFYFMWPINLIITATFWGIIQIASVKYHSSYYIVLIKFCPKPCWCFDTLTSVRVRDVPLKFKGSAVSLLQKKEIKKRTGKKKKNITNLQ